MKVVITGSRGLLGEALCREATHRGIECVALERSVIWDADEPAFLHAAEGATHVIHAAANTNVEECERNPEACYRDNLLLTELLLKRTARQGCHFTYISSTGVYGFQRRDAYREYDHAEPSTHHHRSKYLSEQMVRAASPSNLVVRTGWLFGGRPENPKNFVARRIDEAMRCRAEGAPMCSNHEQFGNPSYTLDVAQGIWTLIQGQHTGLFNCVNDGWASRWEYVAKILELCEIPIELKKTSASSFNRIAKVSNNEMALNWKAENLGLPRMRRWEVALQEYMALLASEK